MYAVQNQLFIDSSRTHLAIGWIIVTIIFAFMQIYIPSSILLLNALLIFAFALMLNLIVRSIDVKIINLFFIFSASYLIPIYFFSFQNKIITSYSHSNGIELLTKYVVIYNIFFSILAQVNFSNIKWNITVRRKTNNPIFYINIAIGFLITLFSKSGESIFDSGGYGQAEITSLGGFAISEYFFIFFFCAYKFSGNGRFNKIILIILAILYIVKSLSFGLRNECIQLGLMILILYYKDSDKYLRYILMIVIGFYFSSLFSAFRGDPISFMNSSLSEKLTLTTLFDSTSDRYISHQGDVVHSSCRLINFRDNDIVSNSIIYASGFYFFCSSIVPQKYLPEYTNMASYMSSEYPVGGGGNIFAYFYFWYGYLGVILIGILIAFLIMNYKAKINSIYGAYFVILFSTFPRWFSYGPINIFKMCVYALIIYIIFTTIDMFMKNKTIL